MPNAATAATTVRVTYAELAASRGVSVPTARRLTLRHRWPKQIGNDGLTRIEVPVAFVGTAAIETVGTAAAVPDATATGMATAATDPFAVVPVLHGLVASLRAQLNRAEQQTQAAERRAEAAEQKAQAAEARVRELQDKLEAELIEHRRLLTEQLARRRSWWPWRRARFTNL